MTRSIGVDGNWVMHRAFFTTPDTAQDMGATLCSKFVSMICKDALATKATRIVVAFDGDKIFRYSIWPEYKANRGPSDVDDGDSGSVYDHLGRLKSHLEKLGIHWVQELEYEADDVLASLAKATDDEDSLVVATKDKDAYQYLQSNVRLYDSSMKPNPVYVTERDVFKKLGVTCTQCVDYQTLIGDKIDNVPRLVGESKARKGLEAYGTLKNWLAEDVSLRKTLSNHKAQLALNRKLVKLVTNIEVTACPVKWYAGSDVPTSYIQWRDFCNPKSKGLF